MEQTGKPSFLDARPGKMVFSPDGSRIYYKRFLQSDSGVSDGSIRALDVAGLEAKFLAGDSFETSEVSLASIDLGDNIEPVDLAISSDGRQVYVLTADHSQATFPASVHIFDAATRQNIAPSPVPAGENPIIADLPEGVARWRSGAQPGWPPAGSGQQRIGHGRRAGSAERHPSGDHTLSGEEDPWPVAAEMDKDGNYAVIADFRNRQLIAFDLTRQREVRNLFIDSECPSGEPGSSGRGRAGVCCLCWLRDQHWAGCPAHGIPGAGRVVADLRQGAAVVPDRALPPCCSAG